MKLTRLALAALLALGAVSAQATGLSLNGSMGTLDESGESFGALGLGRGSFSYAYTFSLSTLSDVSGSVESVFGNVSFSNLSIGGTTVSLSPTSSFSFEDLAAGDYTMVVSGSAGRFLYAWGGTVMAQPVPEVQTFAMLLAGLGVMGALAVRRRQFQ